MYHYGYFALVKINKYAITNNRSIILITTLLNTKIMKDNKLDYWIMFVEGDLSLEELQKLLLDYV